MRPTGTRTINTTPGGAAKKNPMQASGVGCVMTSTVPHLAFDVESRALGSERHQPLLTESRRIAS